MRDMPNLDDGAYLGVETALFGPFAEPRHGRLVHACRCRGPCRLPSQAQHEGHGLHFCAVVDGALDHWVNWEYREVRQGL